MYMIRKNVANDSNTLTSTTGGSASGFPLSNMLLESKAKVWRSNATTSQTFELTWVEFQAISAAALVLTNFTEAGSFRFRLYNAEVGGSLLYDSGTMSIPFAYDPPVGFTSNGSGSFPYGGGSYHSIRFPEVSAKRISITIDSGIAAGGAEISRLVIGQAWSPERGVAYGADVTYIDTTSTQSMQSGDLTSNRGTISKIITFTLNHMESVDKTSLVGIVKGHGSSQPVFVSLSPSDGDELYQLHQVYGLISTPINLISSSFNRFTSTLSVNES